MKSWFALAMMILMAGCSKPAPFAPPPTEVAVLTVVSRRLEQVFEFSGAVEARRSVQVRAQVGGVIVARPFAEGQAVAAGAVLYRIDPTAYEAEWRAAKARLSEAEARSTNAQQTLARYTSLLKDNAVSRQDYDNAASQAQQALSSVDEARGVADRARKNLDDTVVKAELSGRVGQALLEVGARVRGTDDVLTTIDVIDPVYVTFRPSAQQLLSWRRDLRTSKMLVPGGPIRMEAILPDGAPAPSTGRLDFIDPVVDPATGTQQLRAEFSNKDRLLVPGQFVRIRLLGLVRDSAVVVPQRAVMLQMGRQSVYVVVAGDTVRARDVVASTWTGDQWLIERGLTPGERVIVDGIQKVGPGAKVKPVPAADSSAAVSKPR
ncbi:MAG TPA: efflux RND transporter periplasmic adaptor subunit [Gemmatimonadales bacterium]|nr:efflux RND transporter periplasmic adaptor subunit [Gemmatimonadales bacterium]